MGVRQTGEWRGRTLRAAVGPRGKTSEGKQEGGEDQGQHTRVEGGKPGRHTKAGDMPLPGSPGVAASGHTGKRGGIPGGVKEDSVREGEREDSAKEQGLRGAMGLRTTTKRPQGTIHMQRRKQP